MDESGVISRTISPSFGSFEQSIADANVTNLMCAGVSSSVCIGCAVTLYSTRHSVMKPGHGREV